MRNPLLLIILLTVVGFIAAQTEQRPRELKWERIRSWKNSNTQAYVDTKSLRKHTEDGKDYSIGMILFRKNDAITIEIHDDKFIANMYASYFIADCATTKVTTITDFYFNLETLPTALDIPRKVYDHSDNMQDAVEVSKEDPLLNILCPAYI